jgi:hypothetical protein
MSWATRQLGGILNRIPGNVNKLLFVERLDGRRVEDLVRRGIDHAKQPCDCRPFGARPPINELI